jgi:formamidopyrimidine-DNA glycosylase
MPELPEVETIKNDLQKTVCGKRIIRVSIEDDRVIRQPAPAKFKKLLEGLSIKRILRRGKLLILELSNGKFLTVHLKLTGQLVLRKSSPGEKRRSAITPSANTARRLSFYLNSGTILDFNDQRLFGELRLVDDWQKLNFIRKLGPEPFDLPFGDFEASLLRKKTAIKPLLLDQSFIAGIGNIYAAEILFWAKIDPRRPAQSLIKEEPLLLYKEMRKVLKKAIKYGGSSVDDYVRVFGQDGGYARFHQVYGREGKSCFVCSKPIIRINQGGRGTYFCAKCQH